MQTTDLLIIAGKGQYPRKLLEGARKAGVGRIGVLSFRGQTDRALASLADVSVRFGIGEIGRAFDWLPSSGFHSVVMVGQISPAALFATRFDALAREMLSRLRSKSAHTIFGAIAEHFGKYGVRVIPASSYMDDCIPEAGVLSRRAPDARELADIARGAEAALAVGKVDVGQTVVVKDGMVLAVEAFEGTNAAIKRGCALGGRGAIVFKAARDGHDMRFDIPVVGLQTMRRLVRSRASAIAFQAGRVILLDKEEMLALADRRGIAVVAVDSGLPHAPTRP